jgi:hypothetical protein
MDFTTFSQHLGTSLPKGLVLENPGGGTSTIEWCNDERICYRRGKSAFTVGIKDLYSAFLHFSGGDVSTRQLKEYAPHVFDSARKGHNCHSTFLFLALQRMGLAGEMWGRGRAGSPFGVTLPASISPDREPD